MILQRSALVAFSVLAASLLGVPPASAETFDFDGLPPGVDRPSVEPDDGFGLPPTAPSEIPLEPQPWVFSVNTTVDAPDVRPGDGVCEAKVDGDKRCTLRAAVEEANATKEVPSIWLPNLGSEYVLDLGALSIERPMAIRGIDEPLVTVDGLQRVFDISSGSNGFTDLIDLSVSGGQAIDGRFPHGGNVLVRNASRVRFLSLDVSEGTASVGAGIALIEDSTAIIEGSTITRNSTEIRARARGSVGGGIAIMDSSDAVIRQTTIADNLATNGGGIYVAKSSLVLDDSVVERNRADIYGGGIAVREQGAVSIVKTQIVGNEAGVHGDSSRLADRHRVGGGLYIHSPYVSIQSSTITDNTVANPGSRYWAPDCYTVRADDLTYALTAIGSGNVIGDLGDECAVVDR